MGFTLKELKRFTFIEKIIIHSHDWSLYLVSVICDGKEHYILDKNGHPITANNKLALQYLFRHYKVGAYVLRHESAYDEMVGHPIRDEPNTLEVPLGNIEHAAASRLEH